MLAQRLVVALTLGTLVPAQTQEPHYWAEELNPVFEVLQEAHLTGSIELAGRCDPFSVFPGFPRFRSAALTASSPLAALREVAASDPEMKVEQDANRTIRMTEEGVPNDILDIKISHIVFQNFAGHNIHSANYAVRVILSAPEVRSFMEAHDIAAPQITGPSSVPGNFSDNWPPDAPQISGSLDDATVLEALDRVLDAFPGEVFVYWNCPETYEKNERSHTKARTEQQEVLSRLLQLSPTPEDPSHQRRIFISFFKAIKGYGGKTLIVGG